MQRKFLLLLWLIIPLFGLTGTGFFVILAPSLALDTHLPVASDYRPNQDDLHRYFALPAILAGGLKIEIGKATAYVNMDLKQEFSAFLMGNSFSNLPLSLNSPIPAVDMNFPRLGYFQWIDDNVQLSLGRRKLAFGPATYSFVLSDWSPYFDHFWLSLSGDAKGREYFYNFFAVSADRTVYGAPKTLLGHRIGFMGSNFRLTLGEENLIYGVYPDLQDLGPFLIYHHTYQNRSNVTATLAGELKVENLTAYGELTLDDFRLKSEGEQSNPTALGWFAGVSYSLWGGDVYSGPVFAQESHALRDVTLEKAGGLKVRYEHYHATPYLYNRNEEIGKFTYPYRFNVLWFDSWPTVTGFFGFPYGPDSSLDLLGLEYENTKVALTILFEYLRKGSIDINTPYLPPFEENWYALKGPIKNTFSLSLEGMVALDENTSLYTTARATLEEKLDCYFNLGFIKIISF